MIHHIISKDVVRDLEANGQLRTVLAHTPALDLDTGEEGHFMMDMPIDSKEVEGPYGRAVCFYQEELSDYMEGDTDKGNVLEL